jgi:hypothetical protein
MEELKELKKELQELKALKDEDRINPNADSIDPNDPEQGNEGLDPETGLNTNPIYPNQPPPQNSIQN